MSTNKGTDNPGYFPTDIRQWVVEVKGVWQYLSKLAASGPTVNDKWKVAQQRAYTERLRVLLDNCPRIPSKLQWRHMTEVLNAWHIRTTGTRPFGTSSKRVRTSVSIKRSK